MCSVRDAGGRSGIHQGSGVGSSARSLSFRAICGAIRVGLSAALLILAVAAPGYGDLSTPGPYAVGNMTVSVLRPDNSTFNSVLYYPATTPGSWAPFNPSGGPYPVIVFGHGWAQDPPAEYYGSTVSHLASHGYLVMLPESYAGIGDVLNTGKLADDLQSSYQYLVTENSNPASWFYQHVTTTGYGAMGHSMGGAAAIIDASRNAAVKTVFGLAPGTTIPSPLDAIPNVHVPVGLLAGDNDGIIPYSFQQSLYSAGNPPIQLATILGGWHFGFEDKNYFIHDSGPVPREVQLSMTRDMSTAWMNLYLKADQSAWRRLWGPESLTQAGIVTSLRPGIALYAAQTQLTGFEGTVVSYAMSVTNMGVLPTSFSLFAEDNHWNTLPSMLQTPVLNPGQYAVFNVDVQLPAGSGGQSDTVLVSARKDADGGTRGYLYLQTTSIPQPRYTLSMTSNPPGGGTIDADPPPGGDGRYLNGTVVTLTANAGTGYAFSSWSGGASGSSNPVQVTMDADKSVTAEFSLPPVTLTLTETNESYGDVLILPEPNDPQNIQFPRGTVVTLTAVSIEGKEFRQWEIMDPNHPDDANFATIDANMSITIVLTDDTHVNAVWKCASQSGLLPMMAIAALLMMMMRHRLDGA